MTAFAGLRSCLERPVLAYSVEKLRQLSKQRADVSRELDSEEFSARNRNSCNLRENEIAWTACSNHAGEFFNRIGRSQTFRTTSAAPLGAFRYFSAPLPNSYRAQF